MITFSAEQAWKSEVVFCFPEAHFQWKWKKSTFNFFTWANFYLHLKIYIYSSFSKFNPWLKFLLRLIDLV